MTPESIHQRMAELMHHKSQLDIQYKQTEQQIFMLQGHINELQHQLSLIPVTNTEATPPSNDNENSSNEETD